MEYNNSERQCQPGITSTHNNDFPNYLNTIKFLQFIHSLKTILKANQLENYFSHRKNYLDTRRGGNSLVERFGEYSG